jgi:trk system potassium uptake protein TrkA
LLRNGADEVIYPEKDIAEKWAERYSLDHIFDYIALPGGFGIYEMSPLKEWVGKSIKESNIAATYKISILGIKKRHDEEMSVMPSADYVIREKEHLMIMASNEIAEKLLTQNKRLFAK